MKKLFSALCLGLMITGLSVAENIAQWRFDAPVGERASFQDSVNGITAAVVSKSGRSLMVMRKEGAAAVMFDNAADDGNVDNTLLLAEDSDVLTGHQKNGWGYASLVIEIEFMPALIKQSQLVRKTQGATDIGYQLWMTQDGRVGFSVGMGPGQTLSVLSKKKVETGKWHKVLAVWDSHFQNYNMQLHLDGYIVWGGSAPTVRLTNTDGPLTLGGLYRDKNNYGQFFCGEIRNVTISHDRPRLFNLSGKCDPVDIKPTGEPLKHQSGLIRSEFIYQTPPTPECHAATIEDLGNGKLAAAWFGGTHEGHTDVAIWFSEFDGTSWSTPRAIVRSPLHNQHCRISLFNPLLFRHSSGTLMLFYKEGWVEEMEARLMTSTDDGKSWSPVRYYDAPLHGPSKNKPIELPDGAILCPAGEKVEITRDMGNTWDTFHIPNPKKHFGVIQPTILTHKDGALQALFRTREGKMAQSWSRDSGRSWTDIELGSLPNNNSGFDAVTLKDGRHLVVYNHAGLPEGRWGGPRTPLNVAVSDDGIHWKAALVLEDEPGEYSYTSVIQAEDGMVYVVYTWHRMRVKWAVIDPSKLELREIVEGQWPSPAVIP